MSRVQVCRTVRRLLRCLPAPALWLAMAMPVRAMPEVGIGFSLLSYVCPSPFEIDFSWTPADQAVFYSLQLVAPLDPTINGGVSGDYLRQFGTIEVAKGQMNSAAVTLAPESLTGSISLQWQVMAGGASGYLGLVPRQQVAVIPVPCSQTTKLDSPYR